MMIAIIILRFSASTQLPRSKCKKKIFHWKFNSGTCWSKPSIECAVIRIPVLRREKSEQTASFLPCRCLLPSSTQPLLVMVEKKKSKTKWKLVWLYYEFGGGGCVGWGEQDEFTHFKYSWRTAEGRKNPLLVFVCACGGGKVTVGEMKDDDEDDGPFCPSRSLR